MMSDMNFIDWLCILILVLVAVLVVLLVVYIPECNHELVYCSDSEHCFEEWHLHEARCKECKEFIGNFTTEEMIEWNGVDRK